MFKLLSSLCACDAISGREPGLHGNILKEGSFSRHETDALGNLICFQDGSPDAPTVLLDAHADEVGFIVRHIDKNGFIFVDAVGGIDPRVLQGTRLTVHGRESLAAMVGDLPPHVSSDSGVPKVGDLPIDTGLPAKEVAELVRIGDSLTYFAPLKKMGRHHVTGKAIDNRGGCAILCELSRKLRSPYNIIYSFSSQEEVGARGITPLLHQRDVSFALCLDMTHGDTPGVERHKTRPLGSGPIIGRGPGIHPAVGRAVEAAAASAGTPYSAKAYPGGMPTNLRSIQVAGKGIPGAQVSAAVRYLHTPAEVADLRDLEACVVLLEAMLSRRDDELVEAVSCY